MTAYRVPHYTGSAMAKQATSFRLSEESLVLLAAIAAKMGISQAAALEIAIRHLAKREGVRK